MSISVPSAGVLELRRPKTHWLVKLGRTAKRKPLGTVSAIIIAVLILLAVFAPIVAPYSPLALSGSDRLQAPSRDHLMGTDNLGRDVLSRIIYGSRISLWVGFLSVVIAVGIGATIGILSGYFGGKVDMVGQRIVDGIQALPGLVLALTLVVVLGPSATNVIIAIAIVIIPSNSRVVRGAVLSVKEEMYIDAARAIGSQNLRIMLRHILPNVVAPIIILASLLFGNAIIIEASLSFLGLGTPPPAPSWGGMLNGAGRQFMERVPTLALFPGLAISIAVLAFNLFGDTLRDVLDPRLRGGR